MFCLAGECEVGKNAGFGWYYWTCVEVITGGFPRQHQGCVCVRVNQRISRRGLGNGKGFGRGGNNLKNIWKRDEN